MSELYDTMRDATEGQMVPWRVYQESQSEITRLQTALAEEKDSHKETLDILRRVREGRDCLRAEVASTAAMKAREADSAQKEIARIRSDNEKLKAHLERAGKVALHCGLVLKRLERMADVMTALGPAVDALREYDDCMISDLPSGDKND